MMSMREHSSPVVVVYHHALLGEGITTYLVHAGIPACGVCDLDVIRLLDALGPDTRLIVWEPCTHLDGAWLRGRAAGADLVMLPRLIDGPSDQGGPSDPLTALLQRARDLVGLSAPV
jgi:hypothetical protein